MILFIDTEFDGFGGDLISMALVPEDDNLDPWYEVRETGITDPWVLKNVIPVLNKEPLRPLLFKLSFQNYISKFKNPTIIAAWYTEAVWFASLMAGHDHASSLNLEFTIKVMKTPGSGALSKVPHNALSDAQALKEWYKQGVAAFGSQK